MDFCEKYLAYNNEKNRFAIHNHILLTRLVPDEAEGELTVCQDGMNPIGSLHGGAYFTLADCVASAVARSREINYVTQSCSFHYLRSVKEGKIYARGKVRHRGRTTCLVAVEVTDPEGRLLAEGTFNMFSLGKPMVFD